MRITFIKKRILVLAGILPLLFFGCGKNSGGDGIKESNSEIEDLGTIGGESSEVDEAAGTSDPDGETPSDGIKVVTRLANAKPKVRDYKQFLYTYTGVLELDPQQAEIVTEFRRLETNLPTNSQVTNFLGSHQLALVKFGSYLCNRAFTTKSPEEREKIFGLDPTATAPIDAFGAVNIVSMGKTIMSRFWGVEKSAIANDNANLKMLTSMVAESMAALEVFDVAMNDANRIRMGTNAICTAAITLAQVSFFGY